jgi:hypothetical protein
MNSASSFPDCIKAVFKAGRWRLERGTVDREMRRLNFQENYSVFKNTVQFSSKPIEFFIFPTFSLR